MKKTRCTEEQIAYALRQAELGIPVAEPIRYVGASGKPDCGLDVDLSRLLDDSMNKQVHAPEAGKLSLRYLGSDKHCRSLDELHTQAVRTIPSGLHYS
jgi:hypothetical protein